MSPRRSLIAYSSAERDGVPLPAVRAEDAVSQLIWRVFGPDPTAVRPLLAWAAGGAAAGERGEIWSPSRLAYRIRRVQDVGARTPLHPGVAVDLLVPAAFGEQRQRQRRLFLLAGASDSPGAWLRTNTATAVRVLAALGPTPLELLQAAVARTHIRRASPAPSGAAILDGLLRAGGNYDVDTDLCVAPPEARAWPRDFELLAVTDPDTVYSKDQLTQLFMRVGFAAASAAKNTPYRHPLVVAAGFGQYRVLRRRAAPLLRGCDARLLQPQNPSAVNREPED